MKIDGIDLINNNDITDAVVEHGANLPTGMNANDTGRLFALTATEGGNLAGLYWYDSVAWSNVATSNSTGTDFKESVRVATTANITLSGTQTIDGVAVVASNRVLVKNQSTGSENGIYVVAAGSWSRSSDADISGEVTTGIFCFVEEGTLNAGKGFVLTTANPITLGTTALTFTQFSSGASYTQGTGITISGQNIALDTSYTDTRYVNTTGDTMTGALKLIDGTTSTPSLAFTSDVNSGLYLPSANNVAVVVGNVQQLNVSTTAITSALPVLVPVGSVSSPSYSFSGDDNTGMYSTAANNLDITIGGVQVLNISGAITSTVPFYAPNGLVSAPSYSFTNDPDTGIYSAGANALGFTTGGVIQAQINTLGFRVLSGVIRSLDGTASAPSYTFTSDTDTGMHSSAADQIAFSCGGVDKLFVDSTIIYATVPITTPFGTASTPSYTFSGDTTTGMYHSATNEISFATGGNIQFTINSTNLVSQNYILTNIGNATTPSYSFIGDDNTGMYSAGADSLSLTTGGTQRVLVNSSGNVGIGGTPTQRLTVIGGDVLIDNGTYYDSKTLGGSTVRMLGINPSDVAYVGPIDSGPIASIFNASSTSTYAAFYTSGVERLNISTTRMYSSLPVYLVDGTAGSPSIAFNGETNTGIYRSAAGQLSISVLGTTRVTVTATEVAVGSLKITNLATPTVSNDAATKGYVDNVVAGLYWKSPVKVATTANITLSGTQTIDGVAVVAADRVLVKNQSTASQNGIYVVAAGAWTRATDFDSTSPIDEVNSAAVFVMQGTVNGDVGFTQTAAVTTVGTDAMTFVQFSSINSYTQGTGISISGQTISLDTSYTDTRYINTSGDTMTGALSVTPGSISAPGLSIAADSSTGIYQTSAGNLSFAVSGAARIAMDSTSTGFANGGNQQLNINSNGLQVLSGVLRVTDGSSSVPSISFNTDTDTGLASGGADIIAFCTGGVLKATLNGSGELDILSGNKSLIIGADNGANLRTNATTKVARVVVPHYTNAEEHVSALFVSNGSTFNDVYIGGGTGAANAATSITFYAAANNTTLSGSEVGSLTTTSAIWSIPHRSGIGSASSPTYSFVGDVNTGIYSSATNNINFATGGVNRLAISSTAVVNSVTSSIIRGTVATPGLNFAADTGTGIYQVSDGDLNIAISGVVKVSATSGQLTTGTNVQIVTDAGTPGAPSYTFSGDADTGMYKSAADQIAFSCGGVARLWVDSLALNSTVPYVAPVGSVGNPSFTFNGDTDTGMFRSAANEVSFSCGGVKQATFYTDGLYMFNEIFAIDGVPGLPGYNFGSENSTGIYRLSAGIMGFSTLGTQRMTISSAGLNMNGNKIVDVATPTATTDAANKAYVDAAVGSPTFPLSAPAGSVTAPSYSFSGDTDTGIYSSAADTLDFTLGGTRQFLINGNTLNCIGGGSVSAPGFAFSGGLGLYKVSGGVMGVTYDGTAIAHFSAASGGIRVDATTNTVTNPGYSFIGDTNTGMYSTSADTVSFAANGANTLTISTTAATFAGDVAVGTVGKGLKVKEGTNAKMGTATLSAGTVTVSTTAVTASSRIFVSIASLGTVTVPKAIGVTAKTAGTSFVITSADATDTSVINWMIFEPA